MRRRAFIAFAALAAARLALAQKTPVIGLLWNDSVKPSPYVAILTDALRDLGYVVGRNLRFDDAVAVEGYGPMAESAARLAHARVDLIVTIGATATLAAAKATNDIPVVMVIGLDPVASGLAASLSRPGRNVTGVWTLASGGLNEKRVELLKEVRPGLSRIGILFAPGTAVQTLVNEAEAAARVLRIDTVKAQARTADDIEAAIADLVRARVGAIFVGSSTLLAVNSRRVVDGIAKRRVPAVYGVERYIDAGGLLVYAPSTRRALVNATQYVDRILKGARPAEMPILQASDVELVINLKTAREIGISIPQSILQRADRAIQ